jgi:hypothetical protein
MGDRKITFFSWRSPALDSQPIRLRTCEEVFVRSGAADLIAVSCRFQASERELGAAGECGLFFAHRYRINQRQRSAVSLPELDDAGQSRLQCTLEGWLIIAGDASPCSASLWQPTAHRAEIARSMPLSSWRVPQIASC